MFYSPKVTNEHYRANARRWFAVSTFWFLLSIGIAIMVPFFTEWAISHYWQEASQSFFIQMTVGNWVEIYLVSALVAFVGFELRMIRLFKNADPNPPIVLVAILEGVAKKAGIETPALIYERSTTWRAATTRSFAAGRKVLWQGDHEKFTNRQVEAIMAHEVGHLVMRDVRTGMIKHFILGGLRFLSIALLLLTCFVSVVWLLQLVPQESIQFVGFSFIVLALLKRDAGWAYFGATFVIACSMAHWVDPSVPSAIWFAMIMTLFGTATSILASHAYSRVIELRTDALGVAILGEDYREDLISALDLAFALAVKDKPKLVKIYQWLPDMLLTHPRNVDRAISLGLKRFSGLCHKFMQTRRESTF